MMRLLRRRHSAPPARLIAASALFVLVSGVACSAASALRPALPGAPGASVTTGAPPAQVRAAAPANAPVANDSVASGAAQQAAQQKAQPAASPAAASSPSDAVPDTSAQILDRMVIRSAQLTVEVQDMESALAQARSIAAKSGGFVSASNTHFEQPDSQSNRMVADLTLDVRSDSADSAISDLRALGKVTSESTGSQDVTDEYVDLDSNLRNLQASETAILKLMDRATQIQDVLSLQRELTNVRGQIERIQGRKTYLERRTDMATITLSLRLPATTSSQPIISGGWDPFATAQRGWQASLTVLRGVADVLIVIVAFSWWLVPLVGVGAYVVLHRRRTPAVNPTESA